VVREGEVAAGDPIELTARSVQEVTIAEVVDRLRERARDRG
jgi:MOSC domain-containing protein YiiM